MPARITADEAKGYKLLWDAAEELTWENEHSLEPMPARMTADEAGEFTLLWNAAEELARENGHSLEWNWLSLMSAFWRGDLSPAGLWYFYTAPTAGREFVVLGDRLALAGLLLGHRAIDTGAASIDELRQWCVADYLKHSESCDCFRRDPDGLLGLAIPTRDFEAWCRGLQTPPSASSGIPTMDETQTVGTVPLAGGKIVAPEDMLRKAPDQKIHDAIAAVYKAIVTGEKPPNLEQIKKPVQERLRAAGYWASGSRIRELAGAEQYKGLRRPIGRTIASERRRQQT